jgi:hypothetical protein
MAVLSSLLRDVWLVLKAAPRVEYGRLRRGPAALLSELRQRGARGKQRTERERVWLSRIVRLVDAGFPGGGNCYRRALFEIALDPVSASMPLRLGLKSGGGLRSGHAWLAANGETDRRYDAEFSV